MTRAPANNNTSSKGDSTLTATISKTLTPETSVELVDPATAQQWLGANSHNRNLRRGVVAAYARDMEQGRWQFTGEAIKFGTNGELLDGQHRLQALVLADATVSMLVVRNVNSEAQSVMDTGARRTAGDALSLNGEKVPALLASAAAMVITEGATRRSSVTHSEIMAIVEADDSIRMICSEVLPRLKLTLTSGTVAFYAYWRLNQIDEAATAQFFDSLSSLVGLEAGSPILALHRRLLRAAEGVGKGSHAYRQEALACIYSAWNAWRRGEKREKIQITYGSFGRIQVPEPK